ncbi:hypothetical protein KUV26_16190 [Leisingera daeponensis]|uniref:Uncharacterized protein n=1 Tax=Leisingera daeponensis TaxID=405746 RepID=A0ABS7NIF1_9RHOB|nr:hypothetical protein [Leisingera daeponensis]MBY6140980.1 hypothetical protein [Leisingera daeponensis]
MTLPGRQAAAAAITLAIAALWAPAAPAQAPLVVGNDSGGYLHQRLIELKQLRRSAVRVEIRGRICYSTCTLFLGLPGTCVAPGTVFGFHGPSRRGVRLKDKDFEYFSRLMARHYPEPLRAWFLHTGRNRISGVYKIKGSELIRMGIAACRGG